jgi:hypothetical protein
MRGTSSKLLRSVIGCQMQCKLACLTFKSSETPMGCNIPQPDHTICRT